MYLTEDLGPEYGGPGCPDPLSRHPYPDHHHFTSNNLKLGPVSLLRL